MLLRIKDIRKLPCKIKNSKVNSLMIAELMDIHPLHAIEYPFECETFNGSFLLRGNIKQPIEYMIIEFRYPDNNELSKVVYDPRR